MGLTLYVFIANIHERIQQETHSYCYDIRFKPKGVYSYAIFSWKEAEDVCGQAFGKLRTSTTTKFESRGIPTLYYNIWGCSDDAACALFRYNCLSTNTLPADQESCQRSNPGGILHGCDQNSQAVICVEYIPGKLAH